MSEWAEVTLGEVLEFKRGHDLSKKNMRNGSIPVAGSSGIVGFHDISTTAKPAVLIGRSGSIGQIYWYDEPVWAHNTALNIKDFRGNNERFVFYWLHQFDFTRFNSGSAVPSLNRNHLHQISCSIAPLEEQQAIAEVLSSLDDKIDLLKRQNNTLEGMAEALFRQWFLEESQDDWEQVSLDELFEVNPKESIAKSSLTPFVEMKNLEEFSSTIGHWRFREFSSGSKFRNGDTLFARITPCLENGKIGLVRSLPTNAVGWGSTEFVVLRPRLRISPLLGFALGINPEFRELAISSMTGSSGRQRARTEVLHNFTLFMPPASILDEINTTIDALESRISMNQAEIKNVTAQRDTLLPKLMSGEVRVQMD